MSRLQETILLSLLILPGLPSMGQTEDAKPSFVFPTDPDYLLINAREIRTIGTGDETRTESWTFRVFGNGRVEIEPAPSWLKTEDVVLEPLAVEQLLRSLDGSLHLVDHHRTLPAPEEGSFIKVHLTRYASADWHEAFDYLDAVVIRDLDVAFRDLRILETWLALRSPQQPIWVSINPWPELCKPERRLEHGLGVPDPVWCSEPPFSRPPHADPDPDEAAREAVRERLRKRLRSLPRGLREQAGPYSPNR